MPRNKLKPETHKFRVDNFEGHKIIIVTKVDYGNV